ncbi:MAG: MBL fold metallo-hydrolase [Lachnospiraceae bacterium]|nr:MBL fold metallo-hydrolase [Lachnospiraceae bacterium]
MSVNIAVNVQSSIRIRGSKTLYFDPWQIEGEPHDGDYVFITHEHYDHFSPEDIMKAAAFDGYLVVPESMAHLTAGITTIPSSHIVTVRPGEKREIARLMVEVYPAYNQNKPFHKKGNGWVGYVITLDADRYYIAGDTDAIPEIRDIRCDAAFLPIGGTYTMDASSAAGLAKRIHPKVVIPTHYGSIVGSPVDGDFFQGLLPRDIRCELLL